MLLCRIRGGFGPHLEEKMIQIKIHGLTGGIAGSLENIYPPGVGLRQGLFPIHAVIAVLAQVFWREHGEWGEP